MTLTLRYRVATAYHLPHRALMNLELIEDKRHYNRMQLTDLETRMRSMFEGEYTATLFELDSQSVAYALWTGQPD